MFAEVTPRIHELHRTQWDNLTVEETLQLDHLLLKALWGDDLGASRFQ